MIQHKTIALFMSVPALLLGAVPSINLWQSSPIPRQQWLLEQGWVAHQKIVPELKEWALADMEQAYLFYRTTQEKNMMANFPPYLRNWEQILEKLQYPLQKIDYPRWDYGYQTISLPRVPLAHGAHLIRRDLVLVDRQDAPLMVDTYIIPKREGMKKQPIIQQWMQRWGEGHPQIAWCSQNCHVWVWALHPLHAPGTIPFSIDNARRKTHDLFYTLYTKQSHWILIETFIPRKGGEKVAAYLRQKLCPDGQENPKFVKTLARITKSHIDDAT